MYKGKEFAKQIHLIQKNATTERKACLKKTTNKQENKISLTQMSEVKLYMKVVKYRPDNKSYSYIKKKLYKCGIFACNLCPGKLSDLTQKPFGLWATVYSWLITQCNSQWSPMTACFFNSANRITSSISSLVVFSLFCNKYLSPAVTPQLSDLDKLQENGLPLDGLRFSQYSLRALCSNHIKITLWQGLS